MSAPRFFSTCFLVCLVILVVTAPARAQYATCGITGSSDTQNRKVLAPVTYNGNVYHIVGECPGDPATWAIIFGGVVGFISGAWIWAPAYGGATGAIGAAVGGAFDHSIPFGNWGVSSNVGVKQEGSQFQGWDKGKPEWNSCTRDYPPEACGPEACDEVNGEQGCGTVCRWYNFNLDENLGGYTQQMTTKGINTHGVFSTWYPVSCPRYYSDGSWHGGCEEIVGATVTLNQNYMTLYELDPGDEDELVQSLYFPDRSATLTTCDPWGCALAASPWADPIAYDDPVWPPLVYTQMAIAIRAELWTWDPWSDCDQYDCGICDPGGYCPPCVPICFIPPC